MRSEKGLSLPLVILSVSIVLIIGAVGYYKFANPGGTNIPSPSPVATLAPSPTIEPTASPSATPIPTKKPVVTPKPTAKPTPTPSPSPSPSPSSQSSDSSSGGSCNAGTLALTIHPNSGDVVGDTLVRISVREDTQHCSANVSKEEIMRQGSSSISIGGLTPAKYNLFVGYHGHSYNEDFEVGNNGTTSKTVNVDN